MDKNEEEGRCQEDTDFINIDGVTACDRSPDPLLL